LASKRKPARFWPDTKEPRIKASPSQEYAARKAALTDPQVRLFLELAEEGIATDPWHRLNRVELAEGIVCDLSEQGILVVYKVRADEVLYLTFRDLSRV
jgi:hypothetical protein